MGGAGSVRANERVVEAFLQDVINEHNGDHAANYLNPDMQWSGGTVGTVTGSANVAGLFASVVAAFPDAHITINDIFGQGDQVVVRVVVSGTQEGAILGIPAQRAPRPVGWRRRLPPERRQDQQHLGRRRLDRDPQRHGHVQGTLDPLTPIRSACCRACTASKTWGWVAAFADDGTVTHESIRVTWHGP